MNGAVEDGGRLDVDDQLVLVPEGLYIARYRYYETRRSTGRFNPKVVMYFEIIEPGEGYGVKLPKFYNVRRIDGSPRVRGGFTPARRGDLYRDYLRLIREPARDDRVRLSEYANNDWIIRVNTVEIDGSERAIPEGARYSVISRLVEPAANSFSRQTPLTP
jgi:hypothetical protein